MDTASQAQDRYYAERGQAATQEDGCLKWLFAGEFGRKTILTELGRIGEPEAIRHMAKHICDLKPHTEEAVAMIRQWQTGKPVDSGVLELAEP